MSETIQDLLEFSRVGHTSRELAPVNLNAICRR
jgi:hypothetical protein